MMTIAVTTIVIIMVMTITMMTILTTVCSLHPEVPNPGPVAKERTKEEQTYTPPKPTWNSTEGVRFRVEGVR